MPREATQFGTGHEAVTIGRNGGRKSGEARRRKREMRERLEALLEIRREGMDGLDALALALYEKALSGDTRAIEIAIDLLEQRPKQTVNFRLPPLRTAQDIAKATAAILAAACSGKITPDEAVKLANVCMTHLKAVESGELEARIAALENGINARRILTEAA